MFYVIDDLIIFKPSKATISNRNYYHLTATLGAPASRCLSVLIEHAPEVVSHQKIIEEVWGSEGMNVPVNTLYQNISIIRKAFKQIEYNDEIIKTVSRKGFVISGVIITQNEESEGVIQLPLRKDLDGHDVINSEITDDNTINSVKSWPGVTKKIFMAFSSILFVSLAFYLYFIINEQKNNFFIKYSNIKHYGKCIVNYTGDKPEKIDSIMKNIGVYLNCDKRPYVYLDTKKYHPANTVVTCKQDFSYKSTDNCSSIYFSNGAL
jgi:DNA-binding winged helix-turn-helix (wHTH) protein